MEQYTVEQINDILANFDKAYTTTENGAITPLTSGSKIIDQFGKAASFRGRDYAEVFKDMEEIWAENPELSLKFIFYLRMISRVTILPNGKLTKKVQKGQGCKDEAFKRLLWVASVDGDALYRNLYLLPIVGSWKDLWTLMLMAHEQGCKLNRNVFYALMACAMRHESQVDLIKKFMPRIKTRSNIKTERSMHLSAFAKEFAKFLGMTPRQYNKFKSDGKAHEFQRLMCDGKFNELEWKKIPGIALGKLTAKEFIYRHALTDKFLAWLSEQDTVKFNGYPYDLLTRIKKCGGYYGSWGLLRGNGHTNIPAILRETTNLQFDHLIATAQRDGKVTENVLCALDTSGSMISGGAKGVTPIDVCLSLGLYFSTLNQGHFHKKVVMFDSVSHELQLEGTFCDMLAQIPKNAWGSTNFMSIVYWLKNYRRNNPEIPLEDFPTTILVVSDMQFNIPRGYTIETNYEAAKHELAEVFPQEYVDKIKFIWWNVNGKHEGMPATMEDGGCYFFSGLDGAVVSLVLNSDEDDTEEQQAKPNKSMEEVLTEALNQEVLSFLQ